MKTLRSFLFWAHLATGAAAGIVILIMCATGATLALKPQILKWIDRDVRVVEAQSRPRHLPSELLTAAAVSRPGATPVSILVERDPEASAAVSFGRDDTVYVNPYSGQVLGSGSSRATAFFRTLENWHRWLSASPESRQTARSVTGASTIAFFGLALSGIFLWWPRKWLPQHVHAILVFRRGLTPRARDFNWHNVIGFWCAPAIIVMAGSGIVMSYPWANRLLYRAMGSEPPIAAAQNPGNPRAGSGSGAGEGRRMEQVDVMPRVDAAWAQAEEQLPSWRTITLRLPARGAALTFTLTDQKNWNAFARSTLTIDVTRNTTQWQPYEQQSLGQKARGWLRFAHTGELGGVATQAIAGVACLGGVILVWTGLALALRRLVGWRPLRRLLANRKAGIIGKAQGARRKPA